MNNKNINASQRLSLKSINTILAVLLAVQLVLVWYSLQPGKAELQPVVTFFNTLQSEQIDHLSISDSDDASLNFSLDSEGKWQIEQSDTPPIPVDHQAVADMINKLTNLQSERLVALTKSSHIRLQVDETVFSKKITLRDKNGDEQILFVGSSPGTQKSHVRSGESEKVYQVKGITSWELGTDSDGWKQE